MEFYIRRGNEHLTIRRRGSEKSTSEQGFVCFPRGEIGGDFQI